VTLRRAASLFVCFASPSVCLSASPSFQCPDGSPPPCAAGRRRGVRYVVEGDFQKSGDRIRVRVRPITVATGTQRWSNAWTRPVTDLLAVQASLRAQPRYQRLMEANRPAGAAR